MNINLRNKYKQIQNNTTIKNSIKLFHLMSYKFFKSFEEKKCD